MKKKNTKKKNKKLRPRGVKCTVCGARLFSVFRHDFKECGCPNKASIDGGDVDYLSIGWRKIKPEYIEWDEKLDGSL